MNKAKIEKVYEDDVVCYIANRHHIKPEDVIRPFLQAGETESLTALEENEREIIRELIRRSIENNI